MKIHDIVAYALAGAVRPQAALVKSLPVFGDDGPFDRLAQINCSEAVRGNQYSLDISTYVCPFVNRGKMVPVLCGDSWEKRLAVAALVKARPTASNGSPYRVLAPLNTARHWNRGQDMVPWNLKKQDVVWRGAATGRGLRRDFVWDLCDRYDVGFHHIFPDKIDWKRKSCAQKPKMSRQEMNKFKYLLSIPGNDKASDLFWKLSSNSVVVSPPFLVESWLFEGLLRPFIHYVPIYSPNDMPTVLAWMRSHDTECRAIVRRANAFASARGNQSTWKAAMELIVKRLAI